MESSQPLRGLGFAAPTLVALGPGPTGQLAESKAAEILLQRLEYLDRL